MSQFVASIYEYVYLIIISALSFPLFNKYAKRSYGVGNKSRALLLIVVSFFVFAIGLRPVSGLHFLDMKSYDVFLDFHHGDPFVFNTDTKNLIFDNLLMFWASSELDKTLFFLTISAIYFVTAYLGIKRLFPNHELAAYLVFLGAFSTFSYATNGIKAGAAASIFIWAISYLNKKWVCIVLVLVSLGFHHSMQLPIAALIIVLCFKNPKYYYYGWFVCFIIATLHITYFQHLFGELTDEQGAGYLLFDESQSEVTIKFRPDFILYSVVPVWIGYQFELKGKPIPTLYSLLLHLYILLNAVWLLCMYAEFNNRIAYLSWLLYPIVLIYPYLYVENTPLKYIHFAKIAKYHLCFTLFMVFIFYTIIK